ncbi:MAG: FprA family A-type flavoprotein [Anaerotignaceae bacterium]
MLKLKDDVFYVGAINPNLRVFDIIMRTEYGTTYNAYLVKGEKTALVEAVNTKYFGQMINKIEEIMPLKNIDYVIFNHTEPDHSGGVATIIDANPNVEIIGTASAIRNVGNVCNKSFKSRAVKTGDTLDLGNGLVFEFITAPNLHWPDSMFTYLPSRKTVFTCDFLGAHYCEPLITDDAITYPEYYEEAFEYYYEKIFSPFKKFVLAGIEKLEELDFDIVCCSHGPILKNGYKRAMELYKEWSLPKINEKNVVVFYVSAYGYTRSAANAFVENFSKMGIKAEAYDLINCDDKIITEKFENATGILLGSPTINRDALKPVWDLLSGVDCITNRGKAFGVFGSYGWSGEACKMLEDRCSSMGLKKGVESYKFLMDPSEEDFKAMEEMAKVFAEKL